MKNEVAIKQVTCRQNKISIAFEVRGTLVHYFSLHEQVFETEYSLSVENVEESIAVIPFVCNVLPIIWLTDSVLKIPSLDEDFFKSIERFKEGYRQMYPMLAFDGDLQIGSICKNGKKGNRAAMLFSGGVDAFATLVAHMEERPMLLTVQGADVRLEDHEGWKHVVQHVDSTCEDLGLERVYIKSNFRTVLRERELDVLVHLSKDAWWHGFQHGIALIGHAAPLAAVLGFEKVYIASSYTAKDNVTCASHPSIDSQVRFCGCSVWHDQFDFTRQEKLAHICRFVRETGLQVRLRVCWISTGGENCCNCEKCYRTIMGLLAEGADPRLYGFEKIKAKKWIEHDLKYRIVFNPMVDIPFWKDIQQRFRERRCMLPVDKEADWIYDFDFDRINEARSKKLKLFIRKYREVLGNVFGKFRWKR